MKKRILCMLALVLALCLLPVLPAPADSLETAAEAYRNAGTFNNQLGLLSELAGHYAAELEYGGWNVDLRVKCAEDLPRDLIPMNFETYGYTKADDFPEETRGHKFIAVYIARDGETPELAGEWMARFPEDMRASSVEEAEYALVAEGWWTPSGYKYIPAGSSSHRDYAAYVLNLKTGKAIRFWSHRNGAKTSGVIGQLSGDNMSSNEMWTALRSYIWGVMRLDLGNGAALLFTPTGTRCYLKGYEGEPEDVAVPEEMEGYPVASMAAGVFSGCKTLKSVSLPDSLTAISRRAFASCEALVRVILPSGLETIGEAGFSGCKALTDMVLPEGLKTIGKDAFSNADGLTALTLPRSVESIGEGAFDSMDGLTEFSIPAGITSLGAGALEKCRYLARVVVEEGVECLSQSILLSDTRLACIWLPASLNRDSGLDSIDAHTVIYAPAGSYALQWAQEHGYEAAACAVPEDMPAVRYVSESGLSFRIFRDEAMLSSCQADDGEISIPETADGIPVTGMLNEAFNMREGLKSVTLPESIRTIHYRAVRPAKGVGGFHVYIPNPDCLIEREGLYPYKAESGYFLTVHGPEGSAVQRYVTEMNLPENILFEPAGEGVDANIRTLKDAAGLAGQVQENAKAFWQTCDQTEYSLLAAVPGYDISNPEAAVILRITKAELNDSSLQMAGEANALKMYATLANTRTDKAYAKAAAQTAQVSRLTPVADGTSAIVVLAYPNDWILVSLMQDGNSQAVLLTGAAGIPDELSADYVAETAASYGVEGDCILYGGEAFSAIAGH